MMMTMNETRVFQIHAHGGVEQLQQAYQPIGNVGSGEVRLRHHAIGVNFIDIYHRTGLYPLTLPSVLGMEGAGVIEEIGVGVSDLYVGQRVAYAANPVGSYCDVRVMPATHLCPLPDAISFETAAAIMLKGMTAQYLLKRCRPVEGLVEGDFVLLHAAAGGVGLIACQWAKALGLRVIGTAGTDAKCDLALAHGAEFAINYSTQNVVQAVADITKGQGVKVVYDSVGRDTWESSLNCLRPFGLMVSFGNASGAVPPFSPNLLAAKGSIYVTRQTLFTHIRDRATNLAMARDLFDVVEKSQVRIHVDQILPFDAIPQAHERLESRASVGSLVISI